MKIRRVDAQRRDGLSPLGQWDAAPLHSTARRNTQRHGATERARFGNQGTLHSPSQRAGL